MNKQLDDVAMKGNMSRPNGASTDVLSGIDFLNSGTAFQRNNDNQGLVFFTRPRLNMSYDNISSDRVFIPLLAENPLSPYRAIRIMLDPMLDETSSLFDSRLPFIPLLSNTLQSLSGFPDVTLNMYTSPEGLRKESYTMIDDVAEINSTFDITATFANIQGDPITKLFHFWQRYGGFVYSGEMVPYPDAILENKIDYQTRIWRLVLNAGRTHVTKIGCANVCTPIADPLAASFNYSRESASVRDNDQITIPFRCSGAEYMDPILYQEFNTTVGLFNPGMRDADGDDPAINRKTLFVKLAKNEQALFNFKAYPHIDTVSLELEWWVLKEDYYEAFQQ